VNLPRPLVVGIACVIAGLLVYNIVADVSVDGYDGYPTTLMLGGILGGILGIHRFMRNGGGGDR